MSNESDPIASKLSIAVGPALSLIPHVGGSLASAWSEWDTRRRFLRIEETLRTIQCALQHCRVNQDAATDEGMHLLEIVLREAQLEHCEKKRERLANVLIASWVSETSAQITFDESMLFVRATVLFDDAHIAILDKLRDAGPNASVAFSEIKLLIQNTENASDAALIILNDICSTFAFAKRAWDLNRPDVKRALLQSGNLSPEGIARKCFHAITERGVRFVDYIVRGSTKAPDVD
jgi:hypothetical protein